MAKNTENKYYVSPFKKDINDSWCCTAIFLCANGKTYQITCSGSGAKAPQAKKDAAAQLEERCAEYLRENSSARRLTKEEVEAM